MIGSSSSIGAGLGAPFALAAIVLSASLILGGATRSGFPGDVALQLAAIPVLLLVIARWRPYLPGAPGRLSFRLALLILILLVLLPALQLIPLPPGIWSKLAGRDIAGAAYAIIDRELPWMPLSLTPRSTWLALLSFIPVVAVFLATVQTGYRTRRALCLLVIGFASFSVFYGMLQVAQGPNSPLRLYAITNPTEAVGLFANRNHYAALMYCALLLLTPWAAAASADLAATSRRKGYPTAVVIAAIASFTVIIMLLSAQIMARSRAGMALAILAVLAALLLPMTLARRGEERNSTGRILILAVILALVFTGQYALDRVLERFDTDTLSDARIPYARNTIEAARAYMPFGSGIGSFVSVYGTFEKLDDIHRTFANRAHNDILEAWLETGVIGIVLFAMFIVWLAGRGLALLQAPVRSSERLDALVARSALLVPVLLLVHSLADYPLRTAAMAAVFAFCCALLIPPPPGAVEAEAQEAVAEPAKHSRSKSSGRRRSSTSPTMSTSSPRTSYPPAQPNHPSPHAAAQQAAAASHAFPPHEPGTAGPPPRPPRSSAADISWPSPPAAHIPPGGAPNASPPKRGERWTGDGNWPEEWRTPPRPAEEGDAVPPVPPPRKPDKPR